MPSDVVPARSAIIRAATVAAAGDTPRPGDVTETVAFRFLVVRMSSAVHGASSRSSRILAEVPGPMLTRTLSGGGEVVERMQRCEAGIAGACIRLGEEWRRGDAERLYLVSFLHEALPGALEDAERSIDWCQVARAPQWHPRCDRADAERVGGGARGRSAERREGGRQRKRRRPGERLEKGAARPLAVMGLGAHRGPTTNTIYQDETRVRVRPGRTRLRYNRPSFIGPGTHHHTRVAAARDVDRVASIFSSRTPSDAFNPSDARASLPGRSPPLRSLSRGALTRRRRTRPPDPAKFLTQPLVSEIYTADPSAHVFGGRIYVYPSHDIEAGVPEDDLGSHFAMRDYRVLSMDAVGGPVTVHGVALDIKDVPWAGTPDVGARRRRPRRQVLPLLPREGQAGRLPHRRGRRRRRRPAPSRPSPRPSRARTAWTPPSSPMSTARRTCTSAASGVGSCSAGRPAVMSRRTRIPPTISRRSRRRWRA